MPTTLSPYMDSLNSVIQLHIVRNVSQSRRYRPSRPTSTVLVKVAASYLARDELSLVCQPSIL